MPFHCQKKALFESGAFLPWEDEKQESIVRIVLLDSPLPEFEGAGSDDILTHTLTATAKQQDDKKKKRRKRGKEGSRKPPLAVVQSEPSRDSLIDSYNADKPLSQSDCDNFIASLFGGEGAAAATAPEPVTISSTSEIVDGKAIYTNRATEPGTDRSDHLADNGTFHIYPDKYGTDSLEVGLFIPKGAKVKKLLGEREQIVSGEGSGSWTNTFAFSFDSGPYKGVEIWFDHVGGTYGGKYESQFLGKQFIDKNNQLIGATNSAGSRQIGFIGGMGGRQSSQSYRNPLNRHTHTTVKLNGKKIDPRKVFCGWR